MIVIFSAFLRIVSPLARSSFPFLLVQIVRNILFIAEMKYFPGCLLFLFAPSGISNWEILGYPSTSWQLDFKHFHKHKNVQVNLKNISGSMNAYRCTC